MDRWDSTWQVVCLIAIPTMVSAGCSDSSESIQRDVAGPTDTTPSSSDTRRNSDVGVSDVEDSRDTREPDTSRPLPDTADVTTLEDTGPRDTASDAGDGVSDTANRSDATDIEPVEDGGGFDVSNDTSPLPKDTSRSDTSRTDVRPDTTEFQDTGGTSDAGFKCPPANEFRGLCSPTLYCCKNETLGETCQYGNPCEVPEVLADDPEWICEPC